MEDVSGHDKPNARNLGLQAKFSPLQKRILFDIQKNILKAPFQVEEHHIDKLCKKKETIHFTFCCTVSRFGSQKNRIHQRRIPAIHAGS